ncbi:Oidioi.mRNA.OKI2018_I69.chr1.g2034.t1.cds [Oikopleura dioica]|uniref:Oidioi.mRNA.OKI2018_I69.chr1.g2034.t1.cds n=1 Tax=Oikopleura dioica TaxID=34765 RepID=A0ABN7SYX7_OIKDI|nr:Oidioi.mRNA.OKI2018_I69.chr1.g2034.t1.cds [Oikopleura dioica]
MNRINVLKRRENRENRPLAASSPRPGPPYGRRVLADVNGRSPALNISSIPMSGEGRGRLQSEDVPSMDTFSEDTIDHQTQVPTGDISHFIRSLRDKKNKYKRMALEARKALQDLSNIVTDKLPVIDALELGVNKIHNTVEATKRRQNVVFIFLSLLGAIIYAMFLECKELTATTNGSPYV